MYKQSSQTSKYILPKISNNKRITTPKNNFKKFKFDLNNKFTTKNSICEKHREPFINFVKIVIVTYANIVSLLTIIIIY